MTIKNRKSKYYGIIRYTRRTTKINETKNVTEQTKTMNNKTGTSSTEFKKSQRNDGGMEHPGQQLLIDTEMYLEVRLEE